MNRTIVGLATGGLLAITTACTGAQPTSETAASVKLTKAEAGPSCKNLGPVSGSAGGGGYSSAEWKLTAAQNEMRENAAAKGANIVVLDTVSNGQASTAVTGRAFYCEAPPPAPAPAPAAATTTAAVAPAVAPPPAPPEEPEPSAEERLRKLKDLHDQGLINDEDYEQRKNEILQDV